MFTEIYNQLASTDAPSSYDSDCDRAVWKAFSGAPIETTTVCSGGFKLIVRHMEGKLISITPNAASAGRGHLILRPFKGVYRPLEFQGLQYDFDRYGRARLVEAIMIIMQAWESAAGNLSDFYVAVSGRTSCACCGAPLTDELSISRGIGPECMKKIFRPTIGEVQKNSINRAKVA